MDSSPCRDRVSELGQMSVGYHYTLRSRQVAYRMTFCQMRFI
jgi:hypothetical protein